MWVESVSQPNMEELRSIQEQGETNLVRIPAVSNLSALSPALTISRTSSYSSSVIFFDAREYFDSDDDGDAIFQEAVSSQAPVLAHGDTGRRRELLVIKTGPEGVNLWNLLYKNIGKDLSKISMPVTLNEPLSTLHWLCEELEYSDLVDKAVSSCTPLERISLVAAFAISAYGSTRARYKPFNPLLGETYECVRKDKGAVLQNLCGKWSEALYVGKAPSGRCIWRTGLVETEPYYGFSRFAVELNEVTSVERSHIPPTDARLRPDQKALEEGRLKDAENIKLRVEQAQRDRRRQREINQVYIFF